ncbi:MAG: glutamyl-tRNA reductase [Nitrososphaerota archaeon]|nr:glutamyl-tRNA reductase [Nitrososphaerota archaeon]
MGSVPQLLLIGTSHKSAGIAFREGLLKAMSADHVLGSLDSAEEVALLSTCNRFEVYVTTRSPEGTASSFFRAVGRAVGDGASTGAFYQAAGAEAVRHLFRVATGLESVVVGEPQILSQVRAAGISSRKEGTAGAILAPLFDRAYRVGTRVREEHGFESEEASLSDLAVEAVLQIAPKSRVVMLIGTGKMVRLAARRLSGRTTKIIVVTRRKTPPKGLEEARLIRYSAIKENASKCDVIISATAATRPVLRRGDLGGRRSKVVVDLGMPRNVAPDVRGMQNVRLIDLDNLAKMARGRRAPGAMKQVEAATSREADDFYDWLVQTRLSSALADLYSWADAVRTEELKRALGKLNLGSEKEKRVLEAMGRRIVSKLLARPTSFARKRQGSLSEEEKLELLRNVFGGGSPVGA